MLAAIIEDSVAKLNSPECQAVVESIASLTSLDIAAIESKHASNREMSMMRGRGWLPSLAMLASKFIFSSTKRVWSAVRGVFSQKKETSGDGQEQSGNRSGKKPKRGGGAWRCFIHERSQGTKFNTQTIATLSAAYRALTPDEKAKYEEAGRAASAAHREGFKPFPSQTTRKNSDKLPVLYEHPSSFPQPGHMMPDGVIVAASEALDLQMQLSFHGKDNFEDGFQLVKRQAYAEAKAEQGEMSLSKQEEADYQLWLHSTDTSTTVQAFQNAGHFKTCNSFFQGGSSSTNLVSLQWIPPVADALKATCTPVLECSNVWMFHVPSYWVLLPWKTPQTNKTNKNKQRNKKTNKQTNKQRNKETKKQTNKQTNKTKQYNSIQCSCNAVAMIEKDTMT